MFRYFIAVLCIVCNVSIVPGHPFPGHKAKNKDAAVSYTIVTKHEHQMYPNGHEDYQGYPDLYNPKNEDHKKHSAKTHNDHNGYAKYRYSYGVKDPKTGDMKKHWESRDGHKVKGGYSFKEADGTTRLVHYSADKDKGFEAVVKKIGKAKKQKQKGAHSFKESTRTTRLAHHTANKNKGINVVAKNQGKSKKQKQNSAHSFKEANGTTSLVHYTANKGKGFQADVTKIVKAKKQKQKRKKSPQQNYTRKDNANNFTIFAGY